MFQYKFGIRVHQMSESVRFPFKNGMYVVDLIRLFLFPFCEIQFLLTLNI